MLTKEEILSLEAGDELDRYVATQVMKWHRVARPGGGGGIVSWRDKEGRHVALISDFSLMSGLCDSCDYFRPSRVIQNAWRIVDKYPDGVEIIKHPNSYACYIITGEQYRAEGKTAQEAICKAALLEVYGYHD